MSESFWTVKLVDATLYDDQGRALLFSSEAEAITAGLIEWGASVAEYVYAEECRVADRDWWEPPPGGRSEP